MTLSGPVLVTGATGYVGGRLAPRLLARGTRVRALSRSRAKLAAREWAAHPRAELVEADVADPAAVERAARGCASAVYLVHSMGGKHFEQTDREAARAFAEGCKAAGVERVLFLGGLGDEGSALSPHLRSRAEVGHILERHGPPTTTLRAAIILGSGSASFEILRWLVERLPVMITPRWLETPVQPIAIRNVLGYLIGCLDEPRTTGRRFDVGGPDILTYRRIMELYAEEAGLRPRIVLPVPVLTPGLSSLWIHLVTPAPASLARPLAEGLRNPVVCRDHAIRDLVPQELLTCREAIRLALDITQHGRAETTWSDAAPPSAWSIEGDPEWTGGPLLVDEREALVDAPPAAAWKPIERIGGTAGWYYGNSLWRWRGTLDKLAGGVGLRRGRSDPERLRPGDPLDFWRVASIEPEKRLRLLAEMRLPGRAMLEFSLEPHGDGRTTVRQRAVFQPHGLAGAAYWKAIKPLHALVFSGMLRGIAQRAEAQSSP